MAATAASAASAASAAADADASLQLQSALAELSTLLLAGAPTVLTAFDAAAQEHLARNDELLAQVDSARLEIQHTTDVAFANLQVQTQVRRGGDDTLIPGPSPRPSAPPLANPFSPFSLPSFLSTRRSCWRCTR